MNVYDSARMADVLAPLGYLPVDEADAADMVILNTCHIREKATEKVFSELGRMRSLKEAKTGAGGKMILAVAGCVAQAEGAEILRRAPYVDIIFGPQAYHRLPELVARATRAGGGVLETGFSTEPKFDSLPEMAAPQGVSALLTVQEGCDKFCTFCVVPYTRGAEYSRPVAEVVDEARRMVDAGSREITLLGQNVNAYHDPGPGGKGEWGLGRLIRALSEIDGLERIRYTTSHPRDMDDDLIAAHREVEALMPFLHLPVQSGSDRVLAAMNRRHTADEYRRIVERLRRARSDIAFSTDFIVGYPGESERDFADTMALAQEAGFAQAYSFKYSPRPGTPAATESGQIPQAAKERRLAELQTLLNDQQIAFNRSCVGRRLAVLLDGEGRDSGQLVGRSPYMQPVHVKVPRRRRGVIAGTVQDLEIVEAHPNGLSGILAASAPVASADGPSERACA